MENQGNSLINTENMKVEHTLVFIKKCISILHPITVTRVFHKPLEPDPSSG